MRRRTPQELRKRPPSEPSPALQPGISNAALARVLAREPATDTEPPITAPGMTGAQQWNERGTAHYKAGRFEKALAAFAEAYKLNPLSSFLYDQALALEGLGRFAEAADIYERYLAAGPLTGDVPAVRSRIRRLRGEPVPDSEDDEPVTATGKDGATVWFDRAQAAFLAKRFERAADAFRKAFELVPLPAFIFNEGQALEQGGHLQAAANAYEHYLILDPGAKEAKALLAKIKQFRGQAPGHDPDALMDPETDAALAPAVTAIGAAGAGEWYDRGSIAFALGDFKRAYDCFVSAYDLKPFPAYVHNQAACLEKLGNVDGAIQAYERYLALDPKASDGGRVRERIKRLREGPELRKPE